MKHLVCTAFLTMTIAGAVVQEQPNQSLTRAEVIGSVACIHRTASDYGQTGARLWPDGTYHVRYSVFHDTDESSPRTKLVYFVVFNPDGRSGWVYKVYVGIAKPFVDIGQFGTIRVHRSGTTEIDDVWGGLGTHDVITKHLKVIESAPLVRVTSAEATSSVMHCYDERHPAPE